MELNQIRYFVVLARTLHFTRAADACNVSQPALTKAIQKLEEELGGPLFHRERSHTQLTELGRTILPSLERALEAARQAKHDAEAFRRRETSPLRIGLEHSVPVSVLTPALGAMRRQCDHIELSLQQAGGPDLCERMLAGEIDLALFVETPELNERLHRWPLFSERYVLLCPPDHPFKEHALVSVTDLASECVLMHADLACPLRRYLEALFERNGIEARRRHFGTSQEQILEMVRASLGVTLAGERAPETPTLLRRPVAADPDRRTIVLATVAGRRLGPTPSLFLKLVRAREWRTEGSGVGMAAAA